MGGDLLSELSPGPEGSTVQTSTACDYVCCAAQYIRVRVDLSPRRSESGCLANGVWLWVFGYGKGMCQRVLHSDLT